MMIKQLIIALSLGVLCGSQAYAQGLLFNDAELREDLNWLNQQGVIQISTSTWPLSGDEVQRALQQAQVQNPSQQKVLQAVQQHLAGQNTGFKLHALAETEQKNLPQAFADDAKAQYQLGVEGNFSGEHWAAKLKVNAEKDLQIDHDQDFNLEGSYLAAKFWNQWLIAGQIPSYWGPGHDGSLIRGDASRPVYGVTMQRAEQSALSTPWLAWLGPWQYQAFAGQLDDYRAIPDAKQIGLRFSAQPLPYLELAASRAIQWGGKGRPESLNSLWDALVGNKDNGGTGEPDPSNQIAGFDARLNLKQWTDLPMSVYGQYVGEDEAGLLPSKKMYLAGVDYSASLANKPYQVYAEWVDTRTNGEVRGISYNHSRYTDGYYQHGFPLGHALGGDAEMISLGGHMHIDALNRVSGRVLSAKLNQSKRDTNQAFNQEDQLHAVDVTWQHRLRADVPLNINAWVSDSDQNGSDVGASIGIELPLDRQLFGY